MKKNGKRKMRNEKGSITIFVIVTMLFMLIALLLLYARVGNKKNAEERHVKEIEKQYEVTEEQMQSEMPSFEDVVKISFDTRGEEIIEPVYRKVGEHLGNLPTTEKEGHTFEGWFTKAVGGDIVTSETLAPDKNVTYYAHFELIKWTATFDSNGGTSPIPETLVRVREQKLGMLPFTSRRA